MQYTFKHATKSEEWRFNGQAVRVPTDPPCEILFPSQWKDKDRLAIGRLITTSPKMYNLLEEIADSEPKWNDRIEFVLADASVEIRPSDKPS